MLKLPQPFIQLQSSDDFKLNFESIQQLLIHLLDTPVIDVFHIGGTKQTQYVTEPIVDVLVTVKSLHDITSLDEKDSIITAYIDYIMVTIKSHDGSIPRHDKLKTNSTFTYC